MLNKYSMRRFIWLALLTSASLVSGGTPVYLGFTFNDSYDAVIEKLKARKATYDSGYGYQGYADLSLIKVSYDPLFAEHGQLNEAWLAFTPKKILYSVRIEWADAGKTYQVIRDVLDQKYPGGSKSSAGFDTEHVYHDGDVQITLHRNAFGFGNQQSTRLEYVFEPSLKEVEAMKARIEQTIKQKHLEKSGQNL